MKAYRPIRHLASITILGLGALALSSGSAHAATTDCATDWNNFQNNPGYIADYTSGGYPIADHETSSDPSNGGTGVQPKGVDLSSGSASGDPGAFTTPYFGYYNGGTVYDPDDPTTMEDDYIFFRMRLEADPSFKAGFDSNHWNVLLDVDDDGYKEYWIDLDGTFTQGNNDPDRLQILYDNSNRQDIPDPDAVRVELFNAFNTPDNNASCPASSPGLSHTRVIPAADGVDGDAWIEIQVPMTAFDDLAGNQVLYPDSPVAFVFSTSTSNTNPLQKDFMQDLDFLGLNDPITFGDVVIPNGQPQIAFTDVTGEDASFYVIGDQVYLRVVDRLANTDPNLAECITVTVTNPAVGDDETVTLCETGPNSGTFTNQGGACAATITNPSPAPSPPTAWIPHGVRTSGATLEEDWTLTWNGSVWTVSGTVSGAQTNTATPGTSYTSDGGEITFTLYQGSNPNAPSVGTTLEFCTRAADPLTTSSTAGADDDGDLQVFSGDEITVSYTNVNNVTMVDTADIVAPCEAFIEFTRVNGLPSDNFELGPTAATSDELYVTVFLREANTDPLTVQTISITLTGNDTQTLTLTETDVDTGEFRNATGLSTKVSDGVVTANDGLWEDVDGGVVTATYNYTCLGNNFSVSNTADLFYIDAGGRVAFTNGAGTQDVELYGNETPVFVRVTDSNACACTPNACVVVGGVNTLQVTVTSPTGDSETVTVYETAPGSGVFINRRNDLVTTASSAVVTSASSDFITDGVMAGDYFVIATGPDAGTYTVASVDSATQITLTTTLTASRTGIGFTASPLLAKTWDGAATSNDGVIESNHQDALTANYSDCDDGDLDAANDTKTDTARYNAPPLILNEVLFYPDAASECQTETVEILNTSASTVDATGFMVTDTDNFTYTVPQFGGSDLMLQPGERIFLSLYPSGTSPVDFFDSGTYYLFAITGSTFPSQELEDPDSTGPADQVSLFDSSGVVQDYVGWSATSSPPLDFFGDDSPAVLRSIWVDDSYRDVAGMTIGNALRRSPNGFDTNRPADWVYTNNLADCTVIITPARVADFTLHEIDGQAVARFETASENGTMGFLLERRDEKSGQYHRVTPNLVPATMTPQGGVYHVVDETLAGGAVGTVTYRLTEIEAGPGRSQKIVHGPFTVSPTPAFDADYSPHDGTVQSVAWAASNSQEERLVEHRETTRQGRAARASRVGTRIKIALREDGLYRLDAASLAGFFGLPQKTLEAWIRAGQLRLFHRDGDVAWTSTRDGSGLLFWGQAIDSIYTRDNVYWLEKGRGRVMDEVRAPGGRPGSAASTFRETRRFEEATVPATTLAAGPEDDFWYWAFTIAGNPFYGTARVDLPLDGVAASGTASLRVELRGSSSTGVTGEHHVEAWINGTLVGDTRFTGTAARTLELDLDQALLTEGSNELELRGVLDTGAPYSVVFLDAVEIAYERLYRAADDTLLAPAGGESFAATGFVDDGVRVFEMSDPRAPREVTGVSVDNAGDSFALSFKVPTAGASYLATSPAGARSPEAMWADAPSDLGSPSHRAEYLVIAPEPLAKGARELLEYRQSRGLEGELVLLEDVMDEWNGGIADPNALVGFLQHAYRHWTVAPRYVVLVGAGDIDYLDAMGLGANPLPPLLTHTSAGLFAADLRLGDVEDFDGVPEIAVGRVPALTNAEVSAHVERLRLFESAAGATWRSRLLLLADDNPGDDRFARHSESIAAFHQDGTEERFFLGRESASSVRQRLLAELGNGAGWLHYVGHGGMDRMTDEAVLHASDVAGLGNAASPPIVVALSCAVNRFGLPGFASLGEVLLTTETGGAVAVLAPSGLSFDDEAAILGQALFRAVFTNQAPRLGDALVAALEEYSERGFEPEMLRIYNLLGDPALELR